MSNHPFGIIEHHFPPWEDVGVETPALSRVFVAGEEPLAAEFNYILDQLHKFADSISEALRDYAAPQRFLPESMMVAGSDAGTFDALTTVDGRRLPVIKLASGSYEQLRVTARVLKDQTISTPEATKVIIEWSTAASSAKTAEWKVKYVAVAEGGSVLATASTITKQASDSAVANGRVQTEIELPVLTQDKLLLLEIAHDGAIDAIDNDVCVHMIEVI